ncbi:MAG TPA: hypothetical protein PKN24_16825 [bacterium]|nr:hypothetical protein [bacterium]
MEKYNRLHQDYQSQEIARSPNKSNRAGAAPKKQIQGHLEKYNRLHQDYQSQEITWSGPQKTNPEAFE